nr:hypothetical protein [Rubidibacter lacunae]
MAYTKNRVRWGCKQETLAREDDALQLPVGNPLPRQYGKTV